MGTNEWPPCSSVLFHSFINSFILVSSRDYYSEALQAQSRTKKKDFKEMYNLEGWAIRSDRNSKGRSFHADGPTTEKALRCIIVPEGPKAHHNRHWAAEVAKVRGGGAKDTTGDLCSDTILYPLRNSPLLTSMSVQLSIVLIYIVYPWSTFVSFSFESCM